MKKAKVKLDKLKIWFRQSETKFLGVIIDDKLSWKNHVSYLCKKL